MAIFSHGRFTFVFPFVFIFMGHLASAQYVACPRVGEGRNYMGRYCGSTALTDSLFQSCVVREYATNLHVAIQGSINQECQVEQDVARMEREHEGRRIQALTGGYAPPPPLQLPPDYQQVMHRLNPATYPDPGGAGEGYAGGAQPYRQDSCLGDSIEMFLRQEAQQRCTEPAVEIRNTCTDAREAITAATEETEANVAKAQKALLARQESQANPELTFEAACESQGLTVEECSSGPRALIRTMLESLQTHLATIQQNNDTCATAITQLQNTGCFEIYDSVFRDPERVNLIKNYCTNVGLNENVNKFISFMETDANSPAKILKELSTNHIANRTQESTLAADFERLAVMYQTLGGGRETASVPSGDE